MKTLFTSEAISKGGRSGRLHSPPDQLLKVTLGNPLEKGIEKRGPRPELVSKHAETLRASLSPREAALQRQGARALIRDTAKRQT